MPIIKSAKKKLRKDIKRTKTNSGYVKTYTKLMNSLKKAKKGEKVQDILKKTYSAIDKAVKKKIIHKNKGARLKRKAAKLAKK